MTSGKTRFLLEVLGGHPEGIYSIIRKPGEEDHPRDARATAPEENRPSSKSLTAAAIRSASSACSSESFSASRLSSGPSRGRGRYRRAGSGGGGLTG
jgi:hypothetical protein